LLDLVVAETVIGFCYYFEIFSHSSVFLEDQRRGRR